MQICAHSSGSEGKNVTYVFQMFSNGMEQKILYDFFYMCKFMSTRHMSRLCQLQALKYVSHIFSLLNIVKIYIQRKVQLTVLGRHCICNF